MVVVVVVVRSSGCISVGEGWRGWLRLASYCISKVNVVVAVARSSYSGCKYVGECWHSW